MNGMNGMDGLSRMSGLEAARQVNRRFGHLCELTYRCLQVCEANDPDALTQLLNQRQTIMVEIDRLQSAHEPPEIEQAILPAIEPATVQATDPAGEAACDGGRASAIRHVAAERRDLINLLASLDSELIRLSTLKRDAYHAEFQAALNPYHGPADRTAAGRLFSRIG